MRQTVNLFRKVLWFKSKSLHHTHVAQLVEAKDLESLQCEFDSHHEYQIYDVVLKKVYGSVAERLIAAVLKTADGFKSSVSSNLTTSAKFNLLFK